MDFNDYLEQIYTDLLMEDNCTYEQKVYSTNSNTNLTISNIIFNTDYGKYVFSRINSGRYTIYKCTLYKNGRFHGSNTLIYYSLGLKFGLIDSYSTYVKKHGYHESYILNQFNNMASDVSNCYTYAQWYDPDGYDWQDFERDIKLKQPATIIFRLT